MWLASMRLWEPLTKMPEKRPAVPLLEQRLSVTRQEFCTRMPSKPLAVETHPVTEQVSKAWMPCCAFNTAEQFATVQVATTVMPLPELPFARQFVTVLVAPAVMPLPALPVASTPSRRQLTAPEVPRSTPSSPQLRTEPLTTAMLVRPTTVALTPSTVSYTHLRAHETPEHLVC